MQTYPYIDGKWIMFFAKEELDARWNEAKYLYKTGKLVGINSMKVSTQVYNPYAVNKYKNGVIIFYCGPSEDTHHVMKCGKNLLKHMHYNDSVLYYKSDKSHLQDESRKYRNLYTLNVDEYYRRSRKDRRTVSINEDEPPQLPYINHNNHPHHHPHIQHQQQQQPQHFLSQPTMTQPAMTMYDVSPSISQQSDSSSDSYSAPSMPIVARHQSHMSVPIHHPYAPQNTLTLPPQHFNHALPHHNKHHPPPPSLPHHPHHTLHHHHPHQPHFNPLFANPFHINQIYF